MCGSESVPEDGGGRLPFLPDLAARKVQVKSKDGSLRYVNSRVAAHRAFDGGVRNERHGTRCLLHPGATVTSRRMRTTRAVARNWNSGERTKCSSCQSNLSRTGQSTSKNSTSGPCSSLSALEQIKEVMVRVAVVDHTGACNAFKFDT